MNRNAVTIAAIVVVLLGLIAWAVYAVQPKPPIIQVEAGGASVSIGEAGIVVDVPPTPAN